MIFCIQCESKIGIFADDSELYKIILKPSDKISLQKDLTQLSNWSHTWAMSLSTLKCKTLNISRKKLLSNREYHLDGTVLTTASETINLGITTTDNFSGLQTYIRSSCKQTVLLALFAKSAETSVTLTLGNFYTVQLFAPN